MPSQSDLIAALTMPHFLSAEAINATGAPAFTVTFQFEDSAPGDNDNGFTGWTGWDDDDMAALRAALAHIETFLNVDFVEVSGDADADLSLGRVDLAGATAGYGGSTLWTWSDGSYADYDAYVVYDIAAEPTGDMNLVLHELGHALGLDHTFEGITVPDAYDSNHYSVMSYTADPESGTYNDAMMLFDILALQAIWGAADHNAGDTTYTGPRTDNVDTIWDTGGIDTFDASARDHDTILDLHDGAHSTFGSFEDVAIAFGATIENATGGSGNDQVNGNDADNVLTGNGGDDLLKGNLGDDVLSGGGQRDLVRGGSGNDIVAGGSGSDVVYGGDGRDTLRGGPGFDKLWGGDGADTFRFRDGANRDVVRDFQDDLDTLEIVDKGGLAEVLAAASENGDDVLFDFGDGDMLIVRNATLATLTDDLSVI